MIASQAVASPAQHASTSPQARARGSVRQPAGRIIAIASGKGGVGKTWFSISLAQMMARRGRRVLLFDGDLGLANVDIQLGLMPRHDLTSLMTGGLSLPEAVTRYEGDRAGDGFDVLPGRSGSSTLAALDGRAIEKLLRSLREAEQYDCVLLDLGAGIDPAMRRLAASADTVLVIATDEPTSLTDAYAVLKLHARDKVHLSSAPADARVVINQAASLGSGEKTHAILARACRTFLSQEPALAGVVRRDERVKDAIRHQTPLLTRHPDTAASRDLQRILAGLMPSP